MGKSNLNLYVSKVPTGAIIDYLGGVTPSGFLMCDGSMQDRTIFPKLFAVIGYSFGGSGQFFALPDCREAVTAGVDIPGGALNAYASAQSVNASIGTDRIQLTTAMIPFHTHNDEVGAYTDFNQAVHNHSKGYKTNVGNTAGQVVLDYNSSGGFRAGTFYTEVANADHSHGGSTSSGAGSDIPHSNVQRVIVCNTIISYG